MKRLFLVAGYDANGHINSALEYMVKSFAKFGDVVLVMDSDCDDSELGKIKKHCLYANAARHGEYDFGSYKRAFTWAHNKLKNYDFVYLVNDSVYGPLFDIEPYLKKMESFDTDAFGIANKSNGEIPYIQSWFIGMRPTVFLSDWFKEFILSVTRLQSKTAVTGKYEKGFTRGLNTHNQTWQCIYPVYNRGIYNQIKQLYRRGMPFIKRAAFTRHNGALGRQLLYVLNHISPELKKIILESSYDTLSKEYTDWLLTKNPFKIILRNIKYLLTRRH